MINAIVSEVASGLPIYKYEELTADYRIPQHVLKFISDDQLVMDQALIERIQHTPIGTRTGRIEKRSPRSVYESWNEVQREAYRWLLAEETIELYRKAGYPDLMDEWNSFETTRLMQIWRHARTCRDRQYWIEWLEPQRRVSSMTPSPRYGGRGVACRLSP